MVLHLRDFFIVIDVQESLADQPVSGTVNKMKGMFQPSSTTSPSHSKPLHNPREKPLSNGHSQKISKPVPPPRVGFSRGKTPSDNPGHSVSPRADVRAKIAPFLLSSKENFVSQKPKSMQSTKNFVSDEEVSGLKKPSEVVPKSSFSNEEFKLDEKLEPENHAGKSRPFSSIFGRKLRSKEGVVKNTSPSANGEDDKSNDKPTKMTSSSDHTPMKMIKQLRSGKMFGRREPRDTDTKISEPTDPIEQVEPVKLVEPVKNVGQVKPDEPVKQVKPVEPVKQVGQVKPVEPVKQDEPVIPRARASSGSKIRPQLQYENVSMKPVRRPLGVTNTNSSSSHVPQVPKTILHTQPYSVTVIAAPSDPPTSPPPPPPNFKETPFKSKPPDNPPPNNPPPPPPTDNNDNEGETKRPKRTNYENVFLGRGKKDA